MDILYADYGLPEERVLVVGSGYFIRALRDEGHRILYLPGPFPIWSLLRPPRTSYHMWDKLRRFKLALSGPREIEPGLWANLPLGLVPFHPRYGPLAGLALAASSTRFVFPPWSSVFRRLGFDPPTGVLENPCYLHLFEGIGGWVLRITDNLPAFHGFSKGITALWHRAIRLAPRVVSTSKALIDDVVLGVRGKAEGVYHIPNACPDGWPALRPEMPEALASIPKPRAIFVSVFEWWVDVGLILRVADRLRDVNFILLGPWLVKRPKKVPPNVHILGPVPHDQVPGFLYHSDVGFAAFKLNQVTHYVSPIKVYEYLAMGLPAVYPRTREAEAAGFPALLYSDEAEMAERIREALEMGPEDRAGLRAWAAGHTWADRYRSFREVLLEAGG